MGTSPLTLPGDRLPVLGANEDVLRCVVHQEWLERIVPRTVFWSLFGTAVLMLLSRYGWHVTGGVLIGAVGALIIARIAVAIATGIIMRPSRALRFRSAAKKLAARLRAAADLSSPPCTWLYGGARSFRADEPRRASPGGPIQRLPASSADAGLNCGRVGGARANAGDPDPAQRAKR